MRTRAILLLVCVAMLTSCDRIKEGTVIKKEYEPGRHYTTTSFHKIGKVTVPVTHHWYDDPDWTIEIEGYNKKHKLQDRWVYITEEMYDTIKPGDWYCIDNMCHVDDADERE